MALTLTNTIPPVVLAKNDVGIKLQTDNYLISAATVAVLDLIFSSGGLAEENFTLSWENAEVVFTFKSTAPDNSGTQLPSYTSGSVSDWIDTVIPYLKANYYVVRDYLVTKVSTDKIRFTAIASGTTYNFAVAENVAGMTTSNTAAVDAVYQDNFTVNVDVLIEETNGSGSYAIVGSKSQPVDSSNYSVFLVDEFLKAYFGTKIPTYAQATVSKCTELYKNWKFRYAEAYGSVAVFQKTIESSVYGMIKAGVSFLEYPANAYFATWLPANKKFMTWCPNNQVVSISQHIYINYLVFGASVTSLVLKGKCYYSDGANQTVTLLTQTGVVQKEVYMFPAGYTQLNIAGSFTIPSGKTVLKYDLWLIDQASNVISEVKTYHVEEYSTDAAMLRAFIFENSFGAMDSLLCRGNHEDSYTTQAVECEQILEDYWGLSTYDNKGNYFDVDTSAIGSAQVRTGNWLRKDDLLWLKDLLLSEKVFELRGSKYVPVKIKRASFKLYAADQDLYSLEFEVSDGFRESNYSKF